MKIIELSIIFTSKLGKTLFFFPSDPGRRFEFSAPISGRRAEWEASW